MCSIETLPDTIIGIERHVPRDNASPVSFKDGITERTKAGSVDTDIVRTTHGSLVMAIEPRYLQSVRLNHQMQRCK
jgi:hypothetical protein